VEEDEAGVGEVVKELEHFVEGVHVVEVEVDFNEDLPDFVLLPEGVLVLAENVVPF
jgi:hypothetical protein